MFGLVFVSRDSEVGTNVSCEESTVSPSKGLIFVIIYTNIKLRLMFVKCNDRHVRPKHTVKWKKPALARVQRPTLAIRRAISFATDYDAFVVVCE